MSWRSSLSFTSASLEAFTPAGRGPAARARGAGRSAVQVVDQRLLLDLQFLYRALDDVTDADDPRQAPVPDHRDVPHPVIGHGAAQLVDLRLRRAGPDVGRHYRGDRLPKDV